jgi:hypothetical protein
MADIIRDRAGQLGKNGEYWMGRKGSGLICIRSFKVVAPACVDYGPRRLVQMNKHLNVLTHMGHMESPN